MGEKPTPEPPPRCPYCDEELVPMLGGLGCPLTKEQCEALAKEK